MKNSHLVMGVSLLALLSACSTEERYDLVLDNGRVIDGTGAPSFVADVGIRDGVIVAIGDLDGSYATHRINVEGQVVSPGFVDLHSHAEREVLELNGIENDLFQGITTILGGNCGGSPVDIGDFSAKAQAVTFGPNMGLLIGHNTVRKDVMGRVDRAPTADEQARMEALVEDAMRDGAFGMSTGLKYIPGAYAKTDEVVKLAGVVSRYGGFYTSHMREEGRGLLDSVKETLFIGEAANLPVHVSHHKAVGMPAWGQSVDTLKMIDDARAKGRDVTLDQYPYTASSTTLTVLFPKWSLEGATDEINARLEDPATRARIKAGIVDNIRNDRGGDDPRRVAVATFKSDPSLQGKNLAEISVLRGRTTSTEDAAETLMELVHEGGGMGIYHAMHEDDVKRIMRHPMTSIATDGHSVAVGEGVPHPRNYGTFPRVLGHYSRDEGLFSLEEAVRKMTSLPASRMGLKNRGVLAKGYVADVVVFNASDVIDTATFKNPHQFPKGIVHVFVNGVAVVDGGARTQAYPGKVLKGPGITSHWSN